MQPLALAISTGTLLRYKNFPTQFLPARPIDIWLPPGYENSSADRYPVLYMHDGQNLFLPENAYAREPWAMDQAIAGLMETKKIPGLIVVGLWNVGENRWGEYLPQKPAQTPQGREFAARFANRLPGEICSDVYLRFLVNELKPFIDAAYRTRPEQSATFIMGSSMGGLISLYALTEYPHIFGGAGCISTHWPAGESLLIDYFGSVLPKPGTHKLYFDFGTETLDAAYEPWQTQMDEKMRTAGYVFGQDWVTQKFSGAAHNEISWRKRAHIPLEFLLGPILRQDTNITG